MKVLSKKLLSICAAAFLLLSSIGAIIVVAAPRIQILPPAGENLLVGGDFETDDLNSWSFTNASVSTAAAYSGSKGVAMHVEPTVSTSVVYLFDQVSLAPNSTYTITADVNPNGLTNLDCSFSVTTGSAKVTKGPALSGNSWLHNVVIATVKTDVEYTGGRLSFSMYKGAEGYAYLDNIYMEANGNEWCPTPSGGMTIGEGVDDDFDSDVLDPSVWLVSNTAWGGANGGLNAANVKLGTEDGRSVCILESHGDQYEGNVQGVGGMTHRVGAGIVTRDYYASARYTVVCKIEPVLGVCTAFWSFSYIGYMEGDTGDGLYQYNKAHNIPENGVRNSEIDWETPSPMDDGGANDVVSHNNLRTNCWGGKRPGEGGNYSGRSHQLNDATVSIADGNWHELVYEWFGLDNPYTTNADNDPAVIWFIDGLRVDGYDINNQEYQRCDANWHGQNYIKPNNEVMQPSPEQVEMGPFLSATFPHGIEVPRYGTRFWLATWFPVKDDKLYCVGKSAYTGWAGTPDYDTCYTYLDSCTILPYTNGGTSYEGNLPVKAQYLGDDGIDLGDEYNVIESVPNKQFALPNEYPNYAESHGLLPAPTPNTEVNGSTITVSWEAISGASGYDLCIDGTVRNSVSSPYDITGMGIGNHTVKLRSKSGNSPSIWSYEALVSVGTPQNVTVTPDGHGVVVTWDPVEGAVDYYMEIDTKPIIFNDSFVSFTSGDTDCEYLKGFSDDTTHMFRVKAVGIRGESNWSGLVQTRIHADGPPIPGLVVKENYEDPHAFQVIIDRVTGATEYQILDYNNNVVTVPLNQWGYAVKDYTNMAPGYYSFKARAMVSGVWSEWSAQDTIIICPEELLAIPGVRADTLSKTSVQVYWNDVNNATGYDMEVDGVLMQNVTSPFVHNNLEEGSIHKYRVRAKNATQTGLWSAFAYAQPGGESGGGGGGGNQYSGDGTIINGTFDGSSDPWTTDGNVTWEDGHMKMVAGDISAIVSQTVYGMKPNTTYTLGGDITGTPNLTYVYIRNTNGSNNELNTRTLPYTFTTGNIQENDGVTFIFSVYKQQTGTVYVDNVSLSEGTEVTEPTQGTSGSSSSTSSTTKKSTTTTTTTTTTKATTTTTQGNVSSDSYVLSLNVTEETPRYTYVNRTDSWVCAKNSNATMTFTLPGVYHGSTYSDEQITACFTISVNGVATAPSSVSKDGDSLLAVYVISMDADKAVTGTVLHPDHDPFTLDVQSTQPSNTSGDTSSEISDVSVQSTISDVSGSTGLLGDVNDDGDIDMKDVLALRRFVAGQSVTIIENRADVNSDGEIDMKDILKLRRIVAGLE
ncbi:MAG: hypothetical protein J6Z00_04520 [Clostridia bacterium]|nr:hypothetical protein [Clostridia bacterium]